MEPNPISIPIPMGNRGTISCVANALYYQKITVNGLEFYGPNAGPIVFEGVGEDVTMQTTDDGGDVLFRSVPRYSQLSAEFSFSFNGPEGPFQLATVTTPEPIPTQPPYTGFKISSEDGGGPDNNDSIMYVVFSPIEAPDQELRDVLKELISRE